MDIEHLRDFCLSLPLVTECFPFDESTLVFKIEGRMFLYTGLEHPELRFNVKCDPDYALELRDRYVEVTPGFHCNKKYWNTVHVTPTLQDDVVRHWVLHSYTEVVKKLNRSQREKINKLLDEWKQQNGIL